MLRGTIDIIQDNSPYIKINDTTVEIPLGLLIEKWLMYYYPILDSKTFIPQINGLNTQIAFKNQFQTIDCTFARYLTINQKKLYEKIIVTDVNSGDVNDRELQ